MFADAVLARTQFLGDCAARPRKVATATFRPGDRDDLDENVTIEQMRAAYIAELEEEGEEWCRNNLARYR